MAPDTLALMRAMKYYFYKVRYDNGGAPAVQDNLLSLAICKPQIRSTICEKDIIFGFGSVAADKQHHLIYVAEVTEKLKGCDYYEMPKYGNRPDSIYVRAADGNFRWKRGSRHHVFGSLIESDLGKPPEYKNANVLLSQNYRYFGANSKKIDEMSDLGQSFEALKEILSNLRQGHRINHETSVLTDLQDLYTLCMQRPSEVNPPTDQIEADSDTDMEDDVMAEWTLKTCKIIDCSLKLKKKAKLE